MATWKKIITEQDKLSELADVTANGSAAGQFLIWDDSVDKYTPARLTEGTYSSITHADAAVTVEISNTNIVQRLGSMTGDDIKIGASTSMGNSHDMELRADEVELQSGKLRATSGQTLTMFPQATSGTNQDGKITQVFGGAGTGSGTPGSLELGAAPQLGSGTTAQTPEAYIRIIGDTTGGDVRIAAGDVSISGDSTGVSILSDITTTNGAIDWDLKDNVASALSFDSTGKAGILEIVTTDSSEKVSMSGDLDVAGTATIADLTVTGTTTTINTTNLDVQDAVIKIANVASPTVDTADGAGIEVEHTSTQANFPSITWSKAKGAGNTDGSGTADGLTGWYLKNARTSNAFRSAIAIMDFKSDAGAPSGNSQGPGSFVYNTNDDALYIRTA